VKLSFRGRKEKDTFRVSESERERLGRVLKNRTGTL